MTEVEGSDQANTQKMENEGIDASVVMYAVDAEDDADAAEEDRIQRAAAGETEFEEEGRSYVSRDEAPPADEAHAEYDTLPEAPRI